MSATQPCDSPGFGISAARQRSQTAAGTGRDEAQPWWERTRSALSGRQPPKAQHRGNAPAPGSACAASAAAIAGCKVCSQTEMESASEQMWGTSLPRFRIQEPELGNPPQRAVHVHGLSPNRRASSGPTWCGAQHRAVTSNTLEIQFGQPPALEVHGSSPKERDASEEAV